MRKREEEGDGEGVEREEGDGEGGGGWRGGGEGGGKGAQGTRGPQYSSPLLARKTITNSKTRLGRYSAWLFIDRPCLTNLSVCLLGNRLLFMAFSFIRTRKKKLHLDVLQNCRGNF